MSTKHTKMNAKLRGSVAAVSSVALFLSAVFLCNITYLAGDGGSLAAVFQHTPEALYLLLFLTFPFFWHVQSGHFEKRNAGPLLTGFFFATFMLFGVAIDQLHDLHPLFASASRTITTLLVWVTLIWFFYLLCLESYRFLSKKLSKHDTKWQAAKHIPTWVIVFVLALGWSPYLIIFFPGTIGPDNLYMYESVKEIAAGAFSSHHSVLPTLLFGGLPDFFLSIFGNFTTATFIQTLICAGIFLCSLTYTLNTIKKIGAPLWVQILSLLFFAFVPIFGLFAQWICKDTLGIAALLWFLSLFAQTLCNLSFLKQKRNCLALVASAALTALFRHERFLLIALCLLPLAILLFYQKKGIPVVLLVLSPLLISYGIEKSIETYLHATSDSTQEAFAMLYNTTARYARDCPNDIPENERTIIANTLGEPEEIAARYSAFSADPIKNAFNKNADFAAYINTWITEGLRHPLVYISALAEQSYGFWALAPQNDTDQDWLFSTFPFAQIDENMTWPGPYRENDSLQTKTIQFLNALRDAPLIGLLCKAGLYVWSLFFAIGFVLWRKDRLGILFVLPFVFMWIICLASPLSASVRYALGIISGLPLFLVFCTRSSSLCNPLPSQAGKCNKNRQV